MLKFYERTVKRQGELYIKWYGQEYEFSRLKRNEFGEVTPEETEKINLRGIFHEAGRKLDLYRVLNITTYGTYLSETMPQIFCLWEDAKKLITNDTLIMNGIQYVVSGIYNIHEMNTLGEISLKLVQESKKETENDGSDCEF